MNSREGGTLGVPLFRAKSGAKRDLIRDKIALSFLKAGTGVPALYRTTPGPAGLTRPMGRERLPRHLAPNSVKKRPW